MDGISYIVLIGLSVLGGVLALLFHRVRKNSLTLVLSFSGAFLFTITILHLIPEVYHESSPNLGLWVMGGFFLQLFLEQFSKGLEHGHIHPPEQPAMSFLWSITIGLCLHAFLEGLPLSGHYHGHDALHVPLLLGIALHKMPAAFALTAVMLGANYKKSVVITLLIIFSLMSPLGAFLTGEVWADAVLPYKDQVLAVVIGSFLHISTTILFEAGTKLHRLSIYRIIAIIIGTGIGLLTIH